MVTAGHTAIVTGANHGIGAATAQALAGRGCAVLCTFLRVDDPDDPGTPQAYRDHRAQDAAAIVARIRDGGRAAAVEADLSDPAVPVLLFDTAEEQFGPVDILVNNATGWLGNPKYTGHMVYGRIRKRNGRRVTVPPGEWLWSPEPVHPAIVHPDTWAAAQDIGNGPRDQPRRQRAEPAPRRHPNLRLPQPHPVPGLPPPHSRLSLRPPLEHDRLLPVPAQPQEPQARRRQP